MIFLIVVTNGYVLVIFIGALTENDSFCFTLSNMHSWFNNMIVPLLKPSKELTSIIRSGHL